MKESGIDVVRNVWCAEYEPLVVSPSADCPGYVQVHTPDQASEEFWGNVRLVLPREMALRLAEALTACANEQEKA